LVNALVGSSDDPYDAVTAYRGWLASVFGEQLAEMLARGGPRAFLGMDWATRAGLQDLLPGTRFLADRRTLKDQLESGAFNMLGPAVSAGRDVAVGLGHVLDGRVMDGLIEMTPLALRGPLKAVKTAQQGYTTATGNQLPLEVENWDLLVQSLGFTPSKKAEQSEVNFAFKTRDMLVKQTKAKLSNQFYRAYEQGEVPQELVDRIAAFNAANPHDRISPQDALRSRAQAREVAATSGTGIATLPRYLPNLERYSYAVTK